MDQVDRPLPLRCPDCRTYDIGKLNLAPNAKKIGYCYDCLDDAEKDGTINLKSVNNYLRDSAKFYETCRPKDPIIGERPANYIEELAKKGEHLEKLSQHIDQEKEKVKNHFVEIRRIANEIINEKEKEYIELLDKEISSLSEAYRYYEKLLAMGWPQQPDIQNIYPDLDILKQRMSQIRSIDQLQTLVTGIQEDARIQDLYFKGGDGLFRLKKKMDGLIRSFTIPENSLPKIQSKILNLENLENLMKDLMKGFNQEEVQVENSTLERMKVSIYESKIIFDDQFETLRDWLPKGYKFDLKLLFRSSVDGMSAGKFHEKCDGQGVTITLIKCQFEGAPNSSTLGGFLDQSWHPNQCYSSSKEAFLFSLAEQSHNSVKCPILESHFKNAFYTYSSFGPRFGNGYDLSTDDFKIGYTTPKSYSNAIALQNGYGNQFKIEEVEVYQVL